MAKVTFHFTRKVNNFNIGEVADLDEDEVISLEGGPDKIERAIFGHRASACPKGRDATKFPTYCGAFATGNDVAPRASKEIDEEDADVAGAPGSNAQGDGSATGDSTVCEACGKDFDSAAALATHRKQKKH